MKTPTVIQANPLFSNGKRFQDLVSIVDNHIHPNTLESNQLLKKISSFIGFKSAEMNRIANVN